ncbi:hypothetical protein, partial [Pseudogemmobacter bohemicus]|uniref:hypothetical protein n=1 Tax=Pseudogemmobacter bohemicus TaxID=2250708 RepID=UPI0018E543EE
VQKQMPICFCSDCRDNILIANRISILPHYVEQVVEDETRIVEPVIDDPVSPDAEYQPEEIEINFETGG